MKKNAFTWLPLLAIAIIGLVFHWRYLNDYPRNNHAWAQADRLAITKGFVRNNLNFFEPETYLLNPQFPGNWSKPQEKSITAVDFPIHDYIPAVIIKITGIDEPWISRVYNLLYSFLGLFALYKLSSLFVQNKPIAFLVVLVAATSPVFMFYQATFLPTIPSLANAFIGIYFYFLYAKSGNKNLFRWSCFFMTLAALSRMTFLIPFVAIGCHLILEILRKKQELKKIAVPILVSIMVLVAFSWHNGNLREKYGSLFLGKVFPSKSLDEFWWNISKSWNNWKFDYFLPEHYGLMAIIFGLGIGIFNYNKNYRLSQFAQFTFILWLGNLLFLIAMTSQFKDHDYYFLDSLFLPIILILILLIKQINRLPFLKNPSFSYLLITLFSVILLTSSFGKLKERNTYKYWDTLPITQANYQAGGQILDEMGISENAKILIIEPIAPNFCLMLLNRKGYSTMAAWKERIEPALEWEADYVMFQNEYFLTDIYINYPSIINRLEKIYDNGKLSICTIKNNSQTLEEFLGIVNNQPIISEFLNFDSDSLYPKWTNVLTKENIKNRGDFYTEINSSMEFGLTYSDTSVDFTEKETVIIGNLSLFPQDWKGGAMVVGINNGTEQSFYKQIEISKFIDTNQNWQSVYFQFNIPKLSRNGELRFFLINPAKSTYYLDDFSLRIYQNFGD